MRYLILVAVLFFTSTIYARGPVDMPRGTTRANPNLHGGFNFYAGGRYTGRATSNSFGNYNCYNEHGRMYQRGFRNSSGTYRFQRYGRDFN